LFILLSFSLCSSVPRPKFEFRIVTASSTGEIRGYAAPQMD
jgi:hypothetical protein